MYIVLDFVIVVVVYRAKLQVLPERYAHLVHVTFTYYCNTGGVLEYTSTLRVPRKAIYPRFYIAFDFIIILYTAISIAAAGCTFKHILTYFLYAHRGLSIHLAYL